MKLNKIIISGPTGMIGYAIVRCALKQGINVLCLVRKDSNRAGILPTSDNLEIRYANIQDYAHLEIDGNYDAFFHLAWEKTFVSTRDDVNTQLKNVEYTLDTVRLAKKAGCDVFIGAGSQAEYGIVSVTLRPDTPVDPQSGYGIAKYTAGKLSRLLAVQLGIRHIWFRILSTFGPFDGKNTLVMQIINELFQGHSPELTKCEQIWDYLYCDDAARAFLMAAECDSNDKVYTLGSGTPRVLSEYVNTIKNIVNPAATLQFGKKDYYPHQAMHLCADISDLKKDTGWEPEVSFEEGIRRTLRHLNGQS
jgi:nucleoside-diphosphate-sugar epimerase